MNLNGAILKSYHDEAAILLSYFEEKSNHVYSGISGTIVTQLMQEYNFTVDFLPYPGRYSKMADNLAKFEVDFAAAQITHTKQRIELANPGLTLEKTTIGLIFWKSENESTNFTSILLAFDKYVWIVVGICLLTIYTIIQFYLRIVSKHKSVDKGIILGAVVVFQAMFGNSFDENVLFKDKFVKTKSILVLTLSMTGFLIFASYTSVFTSILAVKELKIPFQSLEEFASLSDFKLRSFPAGSTAADIEKKAKDNAEIAEAVTKFIEPYYADVDDTIAEHTAWMMKNKGPSVGLLSEKDVFYSIVTSELHAYLNCDLL